MDFFSTAADPATDAVSLPLSEDKSDVSDFAQAIADRFGHSASIFTARLPSVGTPPPRQPSSAGPPSFPPVPPPDLDAWLADPSALLVDIRPHAAHTSARIPHAISLCVPSTLLKRPLFSLQKLCAMLPSASARSKFSAWRSSSRILVYDADSNSISESSNISGLLRKFRADGFQGELAWLRGGFQAVWKDRRDIVDTNSPDPENDDDDDDHDKSSQPNLLRTRHLPMAAFSLSSTSIHHASPFRQRQQQQPPQVGRPSSHSTSSNSLHASNPFFDAIRQNTELSHGITERVPLQLPKRVRRRIRELPFPWLQDIAKCAAPAPRRPRTLSDTSTTSDSESGDDSDIPNATEIEEGKEALAAQFYKVELAEQKRLMGIMEHHSRESGHATVATGSEQSQKLVLFPFSITAGVEKGAKNRYRHIWPFEHARVRLHQKKDADDDYVNASYVQPLGTSRRYIATQGPLPATFTDFWTLCWEQNVHVIVMLTREVEGATVKCGSYWTDTEFGPLRLKLVSTEGLAPSEHTAHSNTSLQVPVSSSFSAMRTPASKPSKRFRQHDHYRTKRSEIVKRTFELSHTGYPEAKPRKIVHLQYLEWSDMNVPDDPRGVLGLITQVDEAVREIREDEGVRDGKKERERRKGTVCSTEVDEKTGVAKHAMGSNSPVLLHCSAGVGRTGGFIVVDAVLDALRMELRKKYRAKQEEIARTEQEKRRNDEDGMDLDVKQDIGGEEPPKTVPVQMSSGTGLSSSPSADNLKDDDQHLVVHVPLVSVGMEVDHSHSEGTAEEASPSPPPPDRHKFNKAGTRRWAQNVRDETGVEGERVSERPAQSQEQAKVSADRALYPSGSSSRTGSNPELIVHKSGNSSSSSANGDRTSRSSGSGGVYLTTTSLATSVSGASTTSSVVGGSKEKVNIGVGAETEGSCFAATAHNNEGGTHSRSSSHPLSRETVSSLSSFASSEGESPSRSMSPPDRTSGPSLQLLSHLPVGQDVTVVENHAAEPEVGDMYASEASGAHTIEAPSTTETVGGFDYKEPRPLHEDYTPPLLSTFEDPILEVIQDMREQRMSLCQSLRQYVFVHAAVIEGSLMVLDEEREFAEGVPGWTASKAAEDEKMGDDTEMMRITPEIDEESLMLRFSSPPTSSSDSGASTPSVSSVGNNGRPSLPSRSASRSRSRSTSSRRRRHYQHHHHLPVPPTHLHSSSSQSFLYPNDAVVPPSFASPSYSFSYSYGKRPSSPTELPKEDKKGRVRLSKRPSIERKRRNTDGDGDGIVRTTSSGGAATSGIGDGGQER